nr:transposase [Candidatus Sigynarchaeota archaeon]
MALHVVYQTKKRSFYQTQLDDWISNAFETFDRWHQEMEEWRWQLKKQFYQQAPEYIKATLPPLRRGRKKKACPSRSTYFTNIPSHLAELRRLRWFSRHQDLPDDETSPSPAQDQSAPTSLPENKMSLDHWLLAGSPTQDSAEKIVIPKFRTPRIVAKDEFCMDMTNLGWAALHRSRDAPACLFHVFYMNDFSALDDDELLASPAWKEIGACLPSDIVKYAIGQLMLGFPTYTDYIRMAELIPNFEDHLAIKLGRHPPSGDRLVQGLRAIGVERLRAFSEALNTQFREKSLVKDVVWLWDGVFVEAWMKNERKEGSRNKTELYGGWYNHGGKKKGFGIIMSIIVDWCGFVPIPIAVEVYPANNNDNIMFRDTFIKTIEGSGIKPRFLDTDKGSSGRDSLDLVASKEVIPVMALGENRKYNFIKTTKKEYKFDTITTEGVDESVLEKIYMMRTRIEEMFSTIKEIFDIHRLHGTGKEIIEIEAHLMTIIFQLIPFTAFKIGKPNLAWKPTAFREMKVHPKEVFPDRFKELKTYRWR